MPNERNVGDVIGGFVEDGGSLAGLSFLQEEANCIFFVYDYEDLSFCTNSVPGRESSRMDSTLEQTP